MLVLQSVARPIPKYHVYFKPARSSFQGMFLEIVGPTMIDLKYRVGINYEEISRALLARSLGYLFGALLNGALTDLLPYHVELVAAVGFALTSVGIALTPWSRVLWFLSACFVLQGYGQGAMDVCK